MFYQLCLLIGILRKGKRGKGLVKIGGALAQPILLPAGTAVTAEITEIEAVMVTAIQTEDLTTLTETRAPPILGLYQIAPTARTDTVIATALQLILTLEILILQGLALSREIIVATMRLVEELKGKEKS